MNKDNQCVCPRNFLKKRFLKQQVFTSDDFDKLLNGFTYGQQEDDSTGCDSFDEADIESKREVYNVWEDEWDDDKNEEDDDMGNEDEYADNGKVKPQIAAVDLAYIPDGNVPKVLQTICREDIPFRVTFSENRKDDVFDEKAITRSLRKLDKLVGLEQVKQGIHNFVEIARYLNRRGKSYDEMESLRWNFTGNIGTGKSTVAGILGELLKAMNLLGKGHLVEVKAEALYNVSEYKVDEILRDAMHRSRQGLLFVDGDAPPVQKF